MRLIALLSLAAMAFFAGCYSQPVESLDLPAVTPFDNSSMARAAYLDAYQSGYRSKPGDPSPISTDGPYRVPREMGWRAGQAEAARAKEGKPQP